MKKITLFLSVLLMALVVKAQDAEIETYDFKNWPESSVTLTVGDVIGKVNGADVSQCTYTGLERFAFQGVGNGNGNGIWLRVGYGLYSYGAGRSMSILNLNAGDVVTIKSGSISFPDGAVGNGEWILQTIDGGYVVKMKTNGNIGIAIGKNVYIYSITIEPNGFDPNANVPVTGITLDKSTAEITEGMVLNLLAATLIPDDATDRSITWSSSNEDIATVNGGQVTGVAVGTAVITAEANGFTATCEVSVKEKVVKTSWDFATLQAGLPNKTGMTYAVNTVKVAGTDCSYGINEYEGLAVQEAGAWFLYSDGGLYNGASGGRKIGVLNLKKGQIVTVVANTDTGLTLADATTATQLSVETADGKSTYKYGMKADGTLALNMVRNKVIVSINVEESKILVVTDGENLDASGTYDLATYTRTVNPDYNYGTICLPFAPDAETCENYTFYELGQSTANTVTFVEVETPQANVPYLYSAVDREATTHTFTGGETTVSLALTPASAGTWAISGSFTEEVQYSIAGIEFYAYKPTAESDVLVKATNSVTVKPYRAYFMMMADNGGIAPPTTVRIVVRGAGDNGDGTTGIEEVIAPDQIEGAAPAIYNLMGQPVAQPVKGQIYIVNGKKVVY